jgi:UDP-N-acetylglucosamine acyltransferase
VGSHCVLANGAQLAGHVSLGDHVIVSGMAAIAQFLRIGESAFLGGGAMVVKDIPPFCLASGDRARLVGLNVVGLERRGFSPDEVSALKQAYRILFRSKRVLKDAVAEVRQEMSTWPRVLEFLEFVEAGERGMTRP